MFFKILSPKERLFVGVSVSFTNLSKLFPFKSLNTEPTLFLLFSHVYFAAGEHVWYPEPSGQRCAGQSRICGVQFSSATESAVHDGESTPPHSTERVQATGAITDTGLHNPTWTGQSANAGTNVLKLLFASNNFKKILTRDSWCSSASGAGGPFDVGHSF